MNLGEASDWAVAIGIILSALTLVGVVWKLARAATRIETTVLALAKHQESLTTKTEQWWEAFQAHTREDSRVIGEIQATVNRLVWEMQRRAGDL